MTSPLRCPGPLVWFDVPADARFTDPAAVLECVRCGYVVSTGNLHDGLHEDTPLLREGLTNR